MIWRRHFYRVPKGSRIYWSHNYDPWDWTHRGHSINLRWRWLARLVVRVLNLLNHPCDRRPL